MVHRRDHFFMGLALEQARAAADIGEVPVGCVVVRDDRVIGSGHNRRQVDHDPVAHAEILAIRQASAALGDWRLEGCTLYVTLEPCPMCAGAMVLARLERCVFGCADPKAGFLGSLGDLSDHAGLNHGFEVVQGVRQDESSDVLRAFFRSLRERRRS